MTEAAVLDRRSRALDAPSTSAPRARRGARAGTSTNPTGEIPGNRGLGPVSAPTRTFTDAIRIVLLTVSAIALGLVLNLVVASPLEHRAAQSHLFDSFRNDLAEGTAPIRPLGPNRRPLPLGTPVALLEIPKVGVKEVVGEGTTGSVLMSGPGHLRSTIFPGGAGDSVIFGRGAAYGGPFGRIHELHRGASVTVVTQVGKSTFRVVDIRRAGDVVPALAPGHGRLTLATAAGPAFAPSGVVWVDADLVGTPFVAATPALKVVPPSERPLGIDTTMLWVLVLWLVVLVLALMGAVWTWHRRGHLQAWIIFSAPVMVVAYFVASHASLLLPNLM